MTQHGGEWSDPAFESIAGLVHESAGLVFPPARRSGVEAGIRRAMARTGITQPARYLAALQTGGPALDDLLAELTVGETYFFRDPAQFEFVRREIAPRFAAGGAERLRAWSAGCASGEEPYSVAIALRETGVPSIILGTDVSRARLLGARRARYRAWSLRGVPEPVVRRWFRADGRDWVLDASVRQAVEFRYLNLAEDAYPSTATGVWGMNLILCRNVLIYFDRPTIARVAERLLASLTADGWLLLAASDPPLAEFVPCEAVPTGGGLAYRQTQRARARPRGPIEETAPASVPRSLPAPEHLARTAGALADPDTHAPNTDLPNTDLPNTDLPNAGISSALVPDAGSDAVRRDYEARAYARVVAALAGARMEEISSAHAVLHVRALANLGRLADAERACVAALERHRHDAELHYLHAVLLAGAGHAAASAEAARRALYLNPDLVVARLALATALQRLGRVQDARRAFDAAERDLTRATPAAEVPASDGEPAGRLLALARAQRALLGPSAA